MNIAVEKHSKKKGILISNTSIEEWVDSEVEVRKGSDLNMKIIRQTPKRKIIRYFNLIGEFSLFRAIKKVMLRPVKIRIKTKYTKSSRLDI